MSVRLIHFKCNYDPKFNYEKIATSFFGDEQCLIVAEKLSTNAHVHFQGYTNKTDRQIEDSITALARGHFEVKHYNEELKRWNDNEKKGKKPVRPRPVKMVRKEVDEKGFQYLCKEDRPPLFFRGFTPEQLSDLKKASDEHVEHLKSGLKDHLHSIKYDSQPERAFKRMRLDALEYYEKEEKRPRPAFQKDVLWTMWSHPQRDDAWKEFVSEKI